jgi:hypothetical protein
MNDREFRRTAKNRRALNAAPPFASLKGLGGPLWGASDVGTAASETEPRGYLPRQSYAKRKTILAVPEGAITYIAGMMAA